jgi:hypothetical protein
MVSEEDRTSFYLLPSSESIIKDLVEQVNFSHLVKGKVKSMYGIHSDETGEDRFCIEIAYTVPYLGEDDYPDFEKEMDETLRRELPGLVTVPNVEVRFHPREADTDEREEEE